MCATSRPNSRSTSAIVIAVSDFIRSRLVAKGYPEHKIVTHYNGIDLRYFIGPRADSFSFDVVWFFQVRSFLAQRFFGGPAGIGDAGATLAPNCRGDKFLALGASGEAGGVADHDVINLFNPPSCAPDFTKNLNVTAIVLNVPIAQLGGGPVFDTWSTISVAQ